MSVIDLATYSYNLQLKDDSFTSGMEKAEKSTDKFKNKTDGLSSFLKTSLVGGLVAVGVALGGIAIAGVKATADLDQQMSKFQASTGATVEEAEKVKNVIQDLYKVNTDSYEEIVATSEALKKSMQLSVDEIGQYQQSYMDFAKTTGQANDAVVKDIAEISKAWDLTAEASTKSLDMLKLSNEQFGGDILQIQKALKDVAPAAKALGLSFEETNGYLNLFSSAGLDATQAVTAFTYASKQVSSPAEFKKLLKDIQAIEDPTMRAQKAVELFGSRAGVSLANALDGSKNLDEFLITMQQAEGTVNKASEAFDNNFNVQLDLARKQLGGLTQSLGEQLMPTINSILSWVIENMPTITKTIEIAFNTVGSVISVLIGFIKSLVDTFHYLYIENVRIFELIKNNILITFEIIKSIFNIFTALLKGDWDTFGKELVNLTRNLWEQIKNTFNLSIEIIIKLLQFAGTMFASLGTAMMNMLWNAIKAIWEFIVLWFAESFGNLFTWFEGLSETFFNIGYNLFNWMWDGMKNIWESITSWVNSTISWLQEKLTFWRNSQAEMSSTDEDSEIPSYDVGTPFVPKTGLALIHKGEAIIPAQYNPFNNNTKSMEPATNAKNYNINVEKIVANNPMEFFNGIESLIRAQG